MKLSQCCPGITDFRTAARKTDIEVVLATYDHYLIRQVQDCMRLHPDIVRPEVRDLETDELTQRVRIKFWHALQDKYIEYPRTYLKRIIHSEFIDMVRRIKPDYMLELPVDEEGELYQGHMLITPSSGMADPALEYEEKTEASERLQEVVDVVLALPTRQQQALICEMRDRVDDLDAFSKAFKQRKARIEQWQWPQQKNERLLLRASLTYARLKVDAHMKGTRHKTDGTACNNRRSIC